MTRPAQKQRERHFAETLLEGLISGTVETAESPDFWVRRQDGCDIALEVTEYHSRETSANDSRVAIEARWRKFRDNLERLRDQHQCLRSLSLSLIFRDHRLPRSRHHHNLAEEIVSIALRMFPEVNGDDVTFKIAFWDLSEPRKTLNGTETWIALPSADHPAAAEHLTSLQMQRWPHRFKYPWTCHQVSTAWPNPDPDVLKTILNNKAQMARQSQLGDVPLWLLIVSNTSGDLGGCIFPECQEDKDFLFERFAACYDVATMPFEQVWLLSACSGKRIRLFPFEKDADRVA